MRVRSPKPAPAAPRGRPVVPPELRCGAVTEVWAEAEGDLLHARRNYLDAAYAWRADLGLTDAEWAHALPPRSPYRLSDAGGLERLASYGVSPTQLPDLRAAAQHRVATSTTTRRSTRP